MNPNPKKARSRRNAGFTLPAILVVVAALLVMVIGLLAMSGIERKTARSYVDLQRADMAAQAGLEQVKAVLDKETANDDFLVVQDVPPLPADGNKVLETVPYLYIARGEMSGTSATFRYSPLFSTDAAITQTSSKIVDPPDASGFVGKDPKEIKAHPWSNPARTAWIPIKAKRNGKDQTIARYSYWVEDLQGKINPKIAGNDKAGFHVRSAYPFPAPGIRNPKDFTDDKEPVLNGIALYALESGAMDVQKGNFSKKIIDGREEMLSPDSILAAAGFAPPLARGDDGLLSDASASILERNLSPVTHAYDEKPVIPYAEGISQNAAGKPKLNLNKLLGESRQGAIDQFKTQVDNALPMFAKKGAKDYDVDSRPGGFPDDYLQTLAANAFDYADTDSAPSVKLGTYRGIDACPVMSEVVLRFDYDKHEVINDYLVLTFHARLYAELWNITDQRVTGGAQVSYEIAMNRTPIGSGTEGKPFDESSVLMDKNQVASLDGMVQTDGVFYTKSVNVDLQPDQYKFYKFADITYKIPVSLNKDVGPYGKTLFRLTEPLSKARGMTLRWNGQNIDRVPKLLRDPGDIKNGNFTVDKTEKWVKANQVGASYGSYFSTYVNNLGDPRIANYVRNLENDNNAYPKNLSPNRRNVRRGTIYDGNNNLFYGRVLPSEWPDRGHDAPYGIFPAIGDFVDQVPDDPAYAYSATSVGTAPQRISNAGRFYSATELGNVYDPLMWTMVYDDIIGKPNSGTTDTASLYTTNPMMPASRHVFPDVTKNSTPSPVIGGGNTLRIGRYEHQKFDLPGLRASYLLDLFHAGKPLSDKTSEREGNVVRIDGQVNLNTASRDALRALAAGVLKQDQRMGKVTNWTHDTRTGKLAPVVTLKNDLGTPSIKSAADIIADTIILRRPYAAMGEISSIVGADKKPVFGNTAVYPNDVDIQWTDAAAEEVFARVHDAATLRSRNFRVWVIGQALAGSEANPEILAETRKVYTVFADPGERDTQGNMDVSKAKARVTYENNF